MGGSIFARDITAAGTVHIPSPAISPEATRGAVSRASAGLVCCQMARMAAPMAMSRAK